MLKLLKKADTVLGKVVNVIAITAFSMMVLLIIAQVYTRFFTSQSLTWSEELARYLFVYVIFFSAILVSRDKKHIAIDNLTLALHGVPLKIVLTVSKLIQIAFFVVVLIGAAKFMPTAMLRTGSTIRIPMTAVYICIPVSCAIMALYTLRDLIEALIKKEDGEK